ncbi:chromate efflux transporter [Breoghania sp.]|uniref:chromate efflux transporter n=1 Tax=Breoghania sp. TaxID=2065378 RepID=UPI002AA7B1B8|nr:chromate efflux transporter [Breoghania sp.]
MPASDPAFRIFTIFLRLGLTSFGGPVAHLGYYRRELVERRRWLGDAAYADIVALSQFLPGPASSQTGFAIAYLRGGLPGAIAAFVGFTLPSALLMVAIAYGSPLFATVVGAALIHALKLVAVAVVAQAISGMSRNLCPDAARAGIAFASFALVLLVPAPLIQPAAIALSGLAGWLLRGKADPAPGSSEPPAPGKRFPATLALCLFAILLFGLPWLAGTNENGVLRLLDIFYRAGSLVFGGGHVVLPLLETATVAPGYMDESLFLAGYGAAQALPGPLFAFSAYLGTLLPFAPHPLIGGGLALIAIFLPGFLLIYGALPFWHGLRASPHAGAIMKGANAGVVGLLTAAFYTPIWTSSIVSAPDFVLASGAFLLLTVFRQGSGRVVLIMAVIGIALGLANAMPA